MQQYTQTLKGYDLRNFPGLMPYCSFKNSSGKQDKIEKSVCRENCPANGCETKKSLT
jgi:hypothetical protein